MTKDEAVQKLIDTTDLVAFIKGKPMVADDNALAEMNMGDSWEEWDSITILHNLKGKEALEVFRALKDEKSEIVLLND